MLSGDASEAVAKLSATDGTDTGDGAVEVRDAVMRALSQYQHFAVGLVFDDLFHRSVFFYVKHIHALTIVQTVAC